MFARWASYHHLEFAITLPLFNLPTLHFMQHMLLNAAITPETSVGIATPVSARTLYEVMLVKTHGINLVTEYPRKAA